MIMLTKIILAKIMLTKIMEIKIMLACLQGRRCGRLWECGQSKELAISFVQQLPAGETKKLMMIRPLSFVQPGLSTGQTKKLVMMMSRMLIQPPPP